jgi:hypothetical protein
LSTAKIVSNRIAAAACRHWTRRIGVAPSCWAALDRELDRWPRGTALFWWRDDDASVASLALDRLLAERRRLGLPLALAVVPAYLNRSLGEALVGETDIRILQHGWDHLNYGAVGEPNIELTARRQPDEVTRQLKAGLDRLADHFGIGFLPVLVPPFNALSVELLPNIRAAGLRYISAESDFVPYDLPWRNVHVDVIDWARCDVAAEADIIRPALAALRLRRWGIIRPGSPIGIQTHHLSHNEAIWALVTKLLNRLAQHPAVSFPSIEKIFH